MTRPSSRHLWLSRCSSTHARTHHLQHCMHAMLEPRHHAPWNVRHSMHGFSIEHACLHLSRTRPCEGELFWTQELRTFATSGRLLCTHDCCLLCGHGPISLKQRFLTEPARPGSAAPNGYRRHLSAAADRCALFSGALASSAPHVGCKCK